MPNHILDFRKAIAEKLRAELYPVNVEEFPFSDFTPADIERALRNRHLAVRVAFAGVPRPSEAADGGTFAPLAWAVYVITKDQEQYDRTTIALQTVAAILRVVPHANWDVDLTIQRVRNLQAHQLHRGESDARGMMVWGVSWLQSVTLDFEPPADLREFLTLITRYDLAPADEVIDATDTISMRDE